MFFIYPNFVIFQYKILTACELQARLVHGAIRPGKAALPVLAPSLAV